MRAIILATAVLAVASATGAAAAAIGARQFDGYMVSAQFRCDDFLCPDWELDVSRIDPSWRFHLTEKLVELVPKSPVAAMDFAVATAFNNATRSFYVVASPSNPDTTSVWTTVITPAVDNATITQLVHFSTPPNAGNVSDMHALPDGSLIVLYSFGLVLKVNPNSGNTTTLGHFGNGTSVHVTPASVVIGGTLYAITLDQYYSHASLTMMSVASGAVGRSIELDLKHEHFGLEDIFQAVHVGSTGQIAIFLTGQFDQIVAVDPTSGSCEFIFETLSDYSIVFQRDPSTKTDDTLHTAAYDAQDDRIYFQASAVDSDDDLTTSLFYVQVGKKYPPQTAIQPWTFGYLGYFWVKNLAQ